MSSHPSSVQISSSAPCSQTPTVYVPPLMSETFIPIQNNRQNFIVFYILIFTFSDSRREDSSGPNGTEHYQSSMSSYFPPKSNSDLLLSGTLLCLVICPLERYCPRGSGLHIYSTSLPLHPLYIPHRNTAPWTQRLFL
jgi:hypothetical protein